MADIDADINALKAFHDALARYRYAQRDVADRGDHEIEATRASLEAKASRWRLILDRRRAELEACQSRAAQAAGQGGHVDCSRYAWAVQEAQEQLDHVQRWQRRVDLESAGFRSYVNRFRNVIDADLPRTGAHLQAIIKGLESARRVRSHGT